MIFIQLLFGFNLHDRLIKTISTISRSFQVVMSNFVFILSKRILTLREDEVPVFSFPFTHVRTHTLPLTDVAEEAVDLSSACGFSSSFRTRWSKSSEPGTHDLLSEKISGDRATYTLADMQIRVCVCVCACAPSQTQASRAIIVCVALLSEMFGVRFLTFSFPSSASYSLSTSLINRLRPCPRRQSPLEFRRSDQRAIVEGRVLLPPKNSGPSFRVLPWQMFFSVLSLSQLHIMQQQHQRRIWSIYQIKLQIRLKFVPLSLDW